MPVVRIRALPPPSAHALVAFQELPPGHLYDAEGIRSD
jgi:hypothetical protein